MALIATVRTDDYQDDDPDMDPDFDGSTVCEVEFSVDEIVAVVRKLLVQLEQKGVGGFEILSPDHLLELFENGGEVEVSDAGDLENELTTVEEHLEDVTFSRAGDVHHCEHFLDGMRQLVEAALEHDANIEIVNDDDVVFLEDEDGDDDADEEPGEGSEATEPTEEESMVAALDAGMEDDLAALEGMDADLGADLEAELAAEFAEEFGSAPLPDDEPGPDDAVAEALRNKLKNLLKDVENQE